MSPRKDQPDGWRQPPETTAEPVPLQRPYVNLDGAVSRTPPPHAPAPWPPPQVPRRPPAMRRWRPMRGAIGDDVRTPVVWCEFGRCVHRHADSEATSDQDLHDRAFSAGWRYDAFGRFACPGCVRHDPAFVAAAQPPAPPAPGWG